jgi:hypothetical protein
MSDKLGQFMKQLRLHFMKKYPLDFITGTVYFGENTIAYFPFTPTAIKEQKLKIALVYNYQKLQFEVWLAGQNKQIQKKYLEIFTGSDWTKYHIAASPNEGFSIIDHVLVKNPDFNDYELLMDQIENGTMEFIHEILKVLG